MSFLLAPATAHSSTTDACSMSAATHQSQARHLIRSTYAEHRWHHRHPLGDQTRAALELHASCSPHPRDVRRSWREHKGSFFDYRRFRLVAPYNCGFGGRGSPAPGYYAIPCQVVCGESGGDFHVNADGGYQIIPSTWLGAGGGKYAPTAGGATPYEQSVIARKLWGHTVWYGWKTGCR